MTRSAFTCWTVNFDPAQYARPPGSVRHRRELLGLCRLKPRADEFSTAARNPLADPPGDFRSVMH